LTPGGGGDSGAARRKNVATEAREDAGVKMATRRGLEERSLRSHRASSTVFASRSDVPDNIYSPQQRRNKFVLKNGTGSSL